MKLIDKAAVVAEIENTIADETESIKSFERSKNVSEVQRSNARISVLEYVRSLLDTLEVKEVDLENEITSYILDNTSNGYFRADTNDIAEHFFELGLKVQKGEQ